MHSQMRACRQGAFVASRVPAHGHFYDPSASYLGPYPEQPPRHIDA